jgi:AbrB family looped-hinge helix DNA binding protein
MQRMNKHDRQAGGKSSAKPLAGSSVRGRVRLKVDSAGRVLIPAEMRASLGLQPGSTVLAWLEQGELRLVTPQVAMRQAQELADRLLPGKKSLADELIADRREEARRDGRNG